MSYYRLIKDCQPENWPNDDALQAGSLVFDFRMGHTTNGHRTILVTTWPNGQGRRIQMPREMVEANPAPKYHEFEQLFEYYFAGHDAVPNVTLGTDESLQDDLSSLAHAGCLAGRSYGQLFGGRILLPNSKLGHGEMGFALASKTQGGHLTGEAICLLYRPKWKIAPDYPVTLKFALCDHNRVAGSTANPNRGWHPARCTKCGLDLTVDSGD